MPGASKGGKEPTIDRNWLLVVSNFFHNIIPCIIGLHELASPGIRQHEENCDGCTKGKVHQKNRIGCPNAARDCIEAPLKLNGFW